MLGQDTEFFVFDEKKGCCVPAHSIGVAKEKQTLGYYGSFFRDGYAVEFNASPSGCRAGLWENLGKAMRVFRQGQLASSWDGIKELKALPSHLKLITDPVARVDLSEVNSWPADLKVLGCNPTYDPYIQSRKEVDVDPLKLPFRTTGAHLHHSFSSDTLPLSLSELGLLAKYCDLTIGLIHTVVYGDDLEFQRRTLYGQAGEFRQQKYTNGANGFEYRTLSSRLYNHPGFFGLIVGIFKYMLQQHPILLASGWNANLDAPLQKAINTGKGATELLEELAKFLTKHATYDVTGMMGLGYLPNDWGAAIVKLAKMRKENGILDRFQMWEGQTAGHYGWSEYNDGVHRSSTIGHIPLIKEEPWHL